MRVLVFSLLGLAAAGCPRLDITDYRRPYACVANRDGGLDGGRQCLQGWSCGFDDRCFDRVLDGGQRPAAWRCAEDSQCPNAWGCGQVVGEQRFCQQLDAGAPSPCATDEGCQGGWRCGLGERCFDPGDARDAGARGCQADRQCPDDFRCAEAVPERPQLCIPRDAGVDAWCTTDRGCEGGWRCDLAALRCVQVEDQLLVGQSGALAFRKLNPRHDGEPPPLHFAVTSYSQIRLQPFGAVNAPNPVPGVVTASVLVDGGLRLTAQPRDELADGDGGPRAVFELHVPQQVSRPVVELAVGPQGPLLRYDDGRAALYELATRQWSSWTNCRLVRQADALDQSGTSEVAAACENAVFIGARTLQDAGPLELVPSRNRNVLLLPDHRLLVESGAGWLELRRPDGGALVPGTSLGVAAGWTWPVGGTDAALGIVTTVRTDAGATGLVANLVGFGAQPQLEFSSGQFFEACPGGAAPLQVAVIEDAQRRPAVRARCPAAAGGSYPVDLALFDSQHSPEPAIEDQVPYQGAVVAMRASPFVRGHAGAHGRAWHTQYSDGGLAVGGQPLRAVVLDRQPASLITSSDARFAERRVFALSNGRVFTDDASGGLFSQLKDPEETPLSMVVGGAGLVITDEGLVSTDNGRPRVVATLPPSQRFVAPASGGLSSLRVEGQARRIVLVASSDALFVADVTDALASAFSQPAVFSRVLVPVPGVALRSMTLGPAAAGLLGYLTTNTQNFRFATEDLVRWSLTPVATPVMDGNALPLAVWSEPDGGAARTTFSDGRVWSLPIMVPLSARLSSADGGALPAVDTGRLCGDVFVASREGVWRLEPGALDAGLPGWAPLDGLNAQLDSLHGLRLYETRDTVDRLFVATRSGQVFELTASTPCR